MGAYDCDCINNLEYDRRERKAQLSKEDTTFDLIDRQAVINAIENTNAKMSMPEWDEITNAVMSLPTIQPVVTEINVGDTISRKAAINAVNNAFDRETLLTGFVRSIAVRAIRDMPTIQPEQCGDKSYTLWKESYEELKRRMDELTSCSDIISRQAAIDVIEAGRLTKSIDAETAVNGLMELPTVQPERKMGRWIPDNRPSGGFWVCSECKFPSEAFAANALYKFCPNCGVDMGGELDDNHE